MVFGKVFELFVKASPICVMSRAIMETIFAPSKLDALFRESAGVQYQRELLFSTMVDLMADVVTRSKKSVHSAYIWKQDEIPVSIKALYDKLSRVEGSTSQALVRHVAGEAKGLIEQTGGARATLLDGYRVRILDGNHLAKTHHKLKVLRSTAAGALPGQTLALLDPQLMVIDEVITCEDGHAQERSLLGQVLPLIQKNNLLIADRNFCTLGFLFGLAKQGACFIIRQHGRMPWKSLETPRFIGSCETGDVYEQRVELKDPATGETMQVRRMTLKLSTRNENGDTEIHVLSNLPDEVPAITVVQLYRKRWTLENAFLQLTMDLRCELNTLGYPKAAVFGFCVAVCMYNVLATIKGALRGVHGEEVMEKKVSNHHLADEISVVYGGMMIALQPEEWIGFQTLPPDEMAAWLHQLAVSVELKKYPKQRSSPKKPRAPRPNAQFKHVSTAKLLAEEAERRKKKPKTNPKPRPANR